MLGFAALVACADESPDTQKAQQRDQNAEEDHLPLKRDVTEDYGAEESYEPSTGGAAEAYAPSAEAYAPPPAAAYGPAPAYAAAVPATAYAAAAPATAYAAPTAYAAAAPVGFAAAPSAIGYQPAAYPA